VDVVEKGLMVFPILTDERGMSVNMGVSFGMELEYVCVVAE
jgi:hypothetical protein